MFSIFKKRTPIEKLQNRHAKLLQEAFVLSKSNRSASDAKMVEAQKVEQQINDLQRKA
jgi:hypothetical protein